MIRLHLIVVLLLASSGLAALETPLVIRPPTQGSDLVVVVNATVGTIQMYRANNQLLRQVDSHNFLADLDYLSKVPVPGKREWSLLRTGSTTSTPAYGDMFNQFPQPPRGSDREPLAARAMAAEDEFWTDTPSYDGVVRGAMLENALVLAIPSSYTLLFYYIQNDEIELAGWRNYRIDMYVPQVMNSTPTPEQILRVLPPDVQEARREALEKQMQDLGKDAGKIQLSNSDPWVGASQEVGQLFVLVDPENMRLMTYQFIGRRRPVFEMLSVRNLEIDLMIPTTLNSTPGVTDIIENYNAILERENLPPVNRDYIESLVDAEAVSGNISDFHVVLDPEGNLIMDFSDQRQLLIYRSFGSGNGSELVSARDYTLEAGIGIHRQALQQRAQAAGLMPRIKDAARDKDYDEAFRMAKIALEWHPQLYEEMEKRLGRVLSRDERWQPLLEEAIQEAERLEEQYKRLMEEAQKRREEREARRGGR